MVFFDEKILTENCPFYIIIKLIKYYIKNIKPSIDIIDSIVYINSSRKDVRA